MSLMLRSPVRHSVDQCAKKTGRICKNPALSGPAQAKGKRTALDVLIGVYGEDPDPFVVNWRESVAGLGPIAPRDLLEEPRSRIGPIPVSGAARYSHDFRRLLQCKSGEIPKLYQFTDLPILLRKFA